MLCCAREVPAFAMPNLIEVSKERLYIKSIYMYSVSQIMAVMIFCKNKLMNMH